MTVNYQLMRSNRKSFSFRLQLFIKYLLRIVTGKTKEKFTYDVCFSAPILSPVEVLDLDFISESGTLSATFRNPLGNGGMGNGRNGVVGSLDHKYYLPQAIEAIWVSFVDRKVYSIAALLPYDKIESAFKKYNEIEDLDLCFFPEGKLMLYVKGGGRKILLDWSVSGFEEDDDRILSDIYLKHACGNMKEYFDEVYSGKYKEDKNWLRYLHDIGKPSIVFNKYLQRFNYVLKFEFEDSSTNNLIVRPTYSNHETIPPSTEFNGEIDIPSRLSDIYACWNTNNSRYLCYMYFNEEEIIRLFDIGYGENRMQSGNLVIKVCKYHNLFDISLNVNGKSFFLEKTEIRVFVKPLEDLDKGRELVYINYEKRKNYFLDDKEYFEV